MSDNTLVYDEVEKTDLPASNGTAWLDMSAMIDKAKAIIPGRVHPPALVPPPEVEAFLEREFGEGGMKASAQFLRLTTDHLCLEALYRGEPVACFTTDTGGLIVLAVGESEIKALLRSLDNEESSKVIVMDTDSF